MTVTVDRQVAEVLRQQFGVLNDRGGRSVAEVGDVSAVELVGVPTAHGLNDVGSGRVVPGSARVKTRVRIT